MTHKLKCWPEHYAELRSGDKPFEIRKNDRNFQVGDTLLLWEWNPQTREYTKSPRLVRTITFVTDFHDGLRDGYVCMGLK